MQLERLLEQLRAKRAQVDEQIASVELSVRLLRSAKLRPEPTGEAKKVPSAAHRLWEVISTHTEKGEGFMVRVLLKHTSWATPKYLDAGVFYHLKLLGDAGYVKRISPGKYSRVK